MYSDTSRDDGERSAEARFADFYPDRRLPVHAPSGPFTIQSSIIMVCTKFCRHLGQR